MIIIILRPQGVGDSGIIPSRGRRKRDGFPFSWE